MTKRHTDPDDFNDALNAYLDGQLGPEEAADVETRLADDDEAAARFEAYATHKELIGEGADLLEPDESSLRTAALEAELAKKLERRARPRFSRPLVAWPVNMAAAAALMAVGWFGHATFGDTESTMPAYVSEALGAHRVFAGDFIRPTEFSAATSEDVRAWLSTKLGHSVRIPSLETLGMTLVGTRLHGTREGPILQAIYENENGDRLSLTMARHPDKAPAITFASVDVANKRVGYWSHGPLDYAIVADEVDADIQDIATELQVAGKS